MIYGVIVLAVIVIGAGAWIVYDGRRKRRTDLDISIALKRDRIRRQAQKRSGK